MSKLLSLSLVGILAVGAFAVARSWPAHRQEATVVIPDPAADMPLSSAKDERSIVVAGGCFWGVQAVFQHVKGVKSATSGYAGGPANKAHYDQVSEGDTGHAESVKVVYDASQITLGQLLKVFFSVAHDPTELNRQGPDTGKQYRSAIFFSEPEQEKFARAYITQIDAAKVFSHPIVTEVTAIKAFYPAEAYHQNYARLHPDEPYIAYNDLPKVANLKTMFPALYSEK